MRFGLPSQRRRAIGKLFIKWEDAEHQSSEYLTNEVGIHAGMVENGSSLGEIDGSDSRLCKMSTNDIGPRLFPDEGQQSRSVKDA